MQLRICSLICMTFKMFIPYFYKIMVGMLFFATISAVQDWDYELQQIKFDTSDQKSVLFKLTPKRNGPTYSINGSIILEADVDNACTVEVKALFSKNGDSHYRATPFAIPKQSFYKFMNGFYVKMLQKDLKLCTNLPQVENWETPLKVGTYNFNMCDISNESLPGHMQPGYYKLVCLLVCTKFEMNVDIFMKMNAKSLV